jgi:hypothetical protein
MQMVAQLGARQEIPLLRKLEGSPPCAQQTAITTTPFIPALKFCFL